LAAPAPAELRIITGHSGAVCAVAWSPDGTRLATGSFDRTVRIWDSDSG
jgi:WD40 repeat protein